MVSYSLNNAAKTSLYGLKISENIGIKHVFQSEAFFCSVEISTQVASPPLNDLMRLNRFFIVIYFEHLAKLVCTVYYLHWPIHFNLKREHWIANISSKEFIEVYHNRHLLKTEPGSWPWTWEKRNPKNGPVPKSVTKGFKKLAICLRSYGRQCLSNSFS